MRQMASPSVCAVLYTNNKEKFTMKLWYRHAAANWNEALPLGNGRMGAMIFGGTDVEKYALN